MSGGFFVRQAYYTYSPELCLLKKILNLYSIVFNLQFIINIEIAPAMRKKIRLLAFILCAAPYPLLAQSGKVLIEEHFVENDRGWNLGDDKDVVRKIEGGKMILECKKYLSTKGGYWIKLPDFKLPPTFSVSVTTHWIKNMKTDGTYSPYGLILGDYFFLIYGDGDRRLLKFNATDQKYETIVDWGANSAINKGGSADNKLEVRYKEGKAAFYSNGQMLFKKEAIIPEGSSVKLYVENSEMVTFDDLIVTGL